MASVAGRVTEGLEPLVLLRFVAGREVECLVDTGFTGSLVLPQSLIDERGLAVFGHEDNLQTVGGEQTSAGLAIAQVEWLGAIRSVVVLVKEDFLIGAQLLEEAELVIDYPRRTLIITREEVA